MPESEYTKVKRKMEDTVALIERTIPKSPDRVKAMILKRLLKLV
jgi:hypothetical protein